MRAAKKMALPWAQSAPFEEDDSMCRYEYPFVKEPGLPWNRFAAMIRKFENAYMVDINLAYPTNRITQISAKCHSLDEAKIVADRLLTKHRWRLLEEKHEVLL